MGTAMYGVLQKFNQQNSVPQQPQTQVPQQQGYGEIPDDDYLTGRQVKQILGQLASQSGQPNPALLNMAAQATLATVQTKYGKEFAKYGPEIHSMLGQVPKDQWSIDNLERVVKFVRSEHIDDLVREGTERQIAEMAPTMRSTGGAGSGPASQINNDFTLNSEKIDAGWRERATKAGLTERQVDDYCRVNDMTREAFYKQFEGKVLSDAVVSNHVR
jgi:hypothetical protein